MVYIKSNWSNRDNRERRAKEQVEYMNKNYCAEIAECISNTIIYDVDFEYIIDTEQNTANTETKVYIEDLDTVKAAKKYYTSGKTAILNFASYKNPGGGFISGSKAQEECLCHESFLYNVLEKMVDKYYKWNNDHKNRALYLNRGLYSPNVVFISEDTEFKVDVITCASPNKSAAKKYQRVNDEENTKALKSRIKFVLDIATQNKADTLILGAYGCGVFGQDPAEVSRIFKEYLETTHKGVFKTVVYAIPAGKNLDAFRQCYNMEI